MIEFKMKFWSTRERTPTHGDAVLVYNVKMTPYAAVYWDGEFRTCRTGARMNILLWGLLPD